MTVEQSTWDVDHWDLDQCRYCKGPIEDITEAYCSTSCELKWLQRHDEQLLDYSPDSSSLFSDHATHSIRSTPRSTPISSAAASPELAPILPVNSVPNLPLEPTPTADSEEVRRRRSYVVRNYKYGSSHNPSKRSFPSNYYQSTVGDRPLQPVFVDRSISLGIRKTSVDEIRQKSTLSEKPTVDNKKDESTPTANNRGLFSWRRLSSFI